MAVYGALATRVAYRFFTECVSFFNHSIHIHPCSFWTHSYNNGSFCTHSVSGAFIWQGAFCTRSIQEHSLDAFTCILARCIHRHSVGREHSAQGAFWNIHTHSVSGALFYIQTHSVWVHSNAFMWQGAFCTRSIQEHSLGAFTCILTRCIQMHSVDREHSAQGAFTSI